VVTWSKCGGSSIINLASSIQVSNTQNTNGSGYIATDSVDAHLQQIFGTSYFLYKMENEADYSF
jgi:hypothetical protein